MTRSIGSRLALMFASCGALVFVIGGVLLYMLLGRALDRQVHQELAVRAALIESMAAKANTPALWAEKVAPKLGLLMQEDSGIVVWTVSDDPAFSFGRDAGVAGQLKGPAGYRRLQLSGFDCEHVALARDLPAGGSRPSVRLVVAKDPTLFGETLGRFGVVLMCTVVAGVLLVSGLGWWIARVGLRPVRQLSAQAAVLSPHRPSQRLDMQPLPAELQDLAGSFNGALGRLETAYRQLEAFNADVAHELRTPLMNLIGQTQVILTRPRTVCELEDVMRSNLEELERLKAIVNDMLFMARADQGATALDARNVSLAAEVEKVIEFLEPLLDQGRMSVAIQGDQHVCIESTLFRRAVTNLIQNAIQHSRENQQILVRIEPGPDGARVSVSNPGASIDERHLTHLFDRFYRVDSARQNPGGNHGLGLAIVKAVAIMHRGAVFVRSQGGWNTFGFSVAPPA